MQVSLPASDPLVLSVGGTALAASWATGAYHGETAWNIGDEASGGGYSSLFSRPAYQDGLARATRGVPHLAAIFLSPHHQPCTWLAGTARPGRGIKARVASS